MSILTWFGKAIDDTRATYTLIQESVWKELKRPNKELKPWLKAPFYVASGETEMPLGLVELQLKCQD